MGKYEQGKRRMRQARWTFAALEGSSRYAYLRFLFDARIQCVPWHADHVYSEMLAADLAILPIDTFETLGVTAWKLKSENRLTMKMSMALPVIATPIPSYEGIIEHGVTGFFARSSADWKKCLDALRDPDRRKKMGLAAREAVSAKFAIERQSKLLTNLITAVCPQIESQQIPH